MGLNTCEIDNCKRKPTRAMETVGLGQMLYVCGHCCNSAKRYYWREYGVDSTKKVKNTDEWLPVEYHEDYLMVWCIL